MIRVPNVARSLTALSICLLFFMGQSLAQPKMSKDAQETMGLTMEAVKMIETFENALTNGEAKPDPAQVAVKVGEAVKKVAAKLEEYAKTVPPEKKGHMDTAKVRLGWATDSLEKHKMTKRGHVAVYLQEVVFHVFLSGIKISEK